jgi:hypothetical protein
MRKNNRLCLFALLITAPMAYAQDNFVPVQEQNKDQLSWFQPHEWASSLYDKVINENVQALREFAEVMAEIPTIIKEGTVPKASASKLFQVLAIVGTAMAAAAFLEPWVSPLPHYAAPVTPSVLMLSVVPGLILGWWENVKEVVKSRKGKLTQEDAQELIAKSQPLLGAATEYVHQAAQSARDLIDRTKAEESKGGLSAAQAKEIIQRAEDILAIIEQGEKLAPAHN